MTRWPVEQWTNELITLTKNISKVTDGGNLKKVKLLSKDEGGSEGEGGGGSGKCEG